MRDRVTPDQKIYVHKMMDLVVRIDQILASKEWKRKDLAEALGKQPSEVSKWLNGHNLTIRTLAKVEAALGEELMAVTKQKKADFKPLFVRRSAPHVAIAYEPKWKDYTEDDNTKKVLKIA